jgi:predicted porin
MKAMLASFTKFKSLEIIMNKKISFRKSLTATLIASVFGFAFAPSIASASEADLLKRIDALEAQLNALKAQVSKSVEAKAEAPAQAQNTAAAKAPAVSQTDGITVYGRLDVVMESNDDGAFKRPVMQNISSRIGFKGQRKITDDLSGIMQIESGLAPEDGKTNLGTLATRNTYAGLKSKTFGSVIAGLYDMPFKKLEGNSAPVWGSAEAMEIIIHGKGTARVASSFNSFHTRQANVLQYWSPNFSNMEVKVAYSADEVNGATGAAAPIVNYRKPIYGASFEFDNGSWNAGIATETQESYSAINKNMTGLKATAGMKLGDGTVGLAYSQLDNSIGKKTNNWMIAGTYKFGQIVLKANFGQSSESSTNALDGLSMAGLEVDYRLDKYTTLYSYYTTITNDAKARGRFEAGDNKYSPSAGNDPSILGFGLRYDF